VSFTSASPFSSVRTTPADSSTRLIAERVSGSPAYLPVSKFEMVLCARIYREKASGARPKRRELQRMLKNLVAGDTVTVTRIDRLARSTFDLFGIVKQIVDAKAQFRSWPSRGPTPAPAPGG
jgi:hypothetical protein